MSLRTTTLWTIFLVVALGAALSFAVQRYMVFPEFEELERDGARDHVERVRSAIERELEHLGAFCGDYARWDDSPAYVVTHDPAFERSNFLLETYRENELSMIAYVDAEGRAVWRKSYDVESWVETSVAGLSRERWPADSPLLLRDPKAKVDGLFSTAGGPTLLSARPITHTDGSGPVRGTVLMARPLTEALSSRIREQTGIEFRLFALGDAHLSDDDRESVLAVQKGKGVVLREGADTILGLARMADLAGGPGFVLRADLPRTITPRGRDAFQTATISIVAIGLVILAVLLALLQRTVLAPVARLGVAVDRLAAGGAPEARPKGWAPKELGRLAGQVDHLYEVLKTAEAELRRAKDSAEAANRAKSTFLANVSHEVRTPLNGILGMTHEILAGPLDDDQRSCAERVRSSGEALLGLLNDLLDLSKVEAGRLDLERVAFDLSALVADVADALAARAREAPVEVSFSIARDVPRRVEGDPTRLRQVLTNLGANAVKFTPSGEVHVRVERGRRLDGRAAAVRFSVSDTGIGIPTDRLDRLFKPFSQVDASTTRRYGGTGLGLAICRELVERMGGRIEVETSEGKGSTFSFELPLESAPPATPSAPAGDAAPDLAGVRALVVAPETRGRAGLVERLEADGAHVVACADADEAMRRLVEEAAASDPFLVALVDHARTGEGEALGRRVLGDERLRSTRVVLLAAAGIRGDASRLAAEGFGAYLTKPLRPWQVAEATARVLRGESGAARAPEIVTRHSLAEGHRRGLRVLLAEDNEVNRAVAVRMLRRLGHLVESVEDGRRAVDAALSGRYDVVLMDGQMPELDGYEATRAIREHEAPGVRVPIVAMTASAMVGDRERCLAAGMDDYVAKPIDPKELAATIERVTRGSAPAAAPAAAVP